MLIFILRNHSSLKSHDILIVSEYFCHVFLGWLGLKTKYTTERVFGSAVAIERGNLVLHRSSFLLFDSLEVQINAKFILEVSFSEVVSINDLALSSKNVDSLSCGEISRFVVFLAFQTHTWIDSVYGLFG